MVEIISYNLKGMVEGIDSLVEIFESSPIIAFQGVVRAAFESLFRATKSRGYQYYRFEQINERGGGEFLFSKLPIVKKAYRTFTRTEQMKGISSYLVRLDEEREMWVGTFHLETGSRGAALRPLQIVDITNLSYEQPCILFGDTSIPKWQERSIFTPSGWEDGWMERGTNENGPTDGPDRYQRVWYRGAECLSFDLIPIQDTKKKMETTFALHASFSF